jgi:hypothetical protein
MKTSLIASCSIVLLLAAIVSCGTSGKESADRLPKSDLLGKIKEMEDSITGLTTNKLKVSNLHKLELLNRHLDLFKAYPEDEEAANSLDKVHMLYSGMGVYERSAAYADTLLMSFPKYENRKMMLESQGANYDIFIEPRDSAKVRYYYSLLLKEDKKMDAGKRAGLVRRLKYNHLNFDEYLSRTMQEAMVEDIK